MIGYMVISWGLMGSGCNSDRIIYIIIRYSMRFMIDKLRGIQFAVTDHHSAETATPPIIPDIIIASSNNCLFMPVKIPDNHFKFGCIFQ